MIDIRWERQLHQRGDVTRLAATSDHIVVHERNTRLASLDPVDGSVRWDIPVGTWPRAVVLAGERCLVIPQSPSHLLCLDLNTGERIWSVGLPFATGHLVATTDTVLVGGWRGYTPLSAFDVETGQLRWQTERPVHTVRPVPAGDGFLTGKPGATQARLIDQRDARTLSTWCLPQSIKDPDHRSAFTAVGPDRFLVRCGRRAVAQIVLSAKTATELVRLDTDLATAAPEHAGGLLWLSELRAGYTVVDPAEGDVLWRVDVRQQLVGQVVPTGTGFVVAGNSGTLFHLDHGGQVTKRFAVAERIQALRSVASDELLAVTKGTLLAIAIRNTAHLE